LRFRSRDLIFAKAAMLQAVGFAARFDDVAVVCLHEEITKKRGDTPISSQRSESLSEAKSELSATLPFTEPSKSHGMRGTPRLLPTCCSDGYGSWSDYRLFHFCIMGMLAPERDRKRSIGAQQSDMKAGFVAQLRFIEPI
jgi:hypothetical protein